MSREDGKMRHDLLYSTSDAPFAAYLLLRGFELLGAYDTGSPRKEFGITSTDPEVISNLNLYIEQALDEYENMYLPLPHNPQITVNFRQYHDYLREVKKSLNQLVEV